MSKNRDNSLLSIILALSIVTLSCGLAAPTEHPFETIKSYGGEAFDEAAAAEAPLLMQGTAAFMPHESGDGLEPPNDEPYDDMFFENYGVNPFIDTEDDHFSTFALDVDTGSYSIARRYVSDGSLPPKDAIRVEEFVNYFNQGYASPPAGQAFAIHLDGGPTPYTETERYQILRVGIQGYTVSPEDRKDASLTFVIDVSGSMERENRLELVKDSLELLVEQLGPNDTVAIVVYGSTAHTILEPTSGAETRTIMRAINRLQPEGSTNAEAGIRLGYDLALQSFIPGGINRVILCSDGVANVGNTGSGSIWDTVKAKASEGITLTTLGFGMGNYNDVLMEQLANNGDGFYAYIDTFKEAERIFIDNLMSALQVIALDAKIQVDFNPEVVARYRLVGFENRAIADEDFRNDSVDAGEIGAGHSVTALYEVKLHEGAGGRIATIYLRWEDPDTHEVIELDQTFSSEQFASSFDQTSPYFQWAVLVAEYAEILRGSYWAQNSTLTGLLEEVQRVSRLLDDQDVAEFVQLVRTASSIPIRD
ncbi:MAG: VWA domain-containing protein [Anaerolineae bacterium]|nr:VWA domain-containing protein [Anaerolineae bacterium]